VQDVKTAVAASHAVQPESADPGCYAPNTCGHTQLDVPDQVTGTPTMVGVPSHGKGQDLRRAFSYQYSVASAWWQQWYQWYARNYTGTPFEPLAAVPMPVQQGSMTAAAQPPNHAAPNHDTDGMDWTEAPVIGSRGAEGATGVLTQPARTARGDTSKV
jgi:hypothetical protein